MTTQEAAPQEQQPPQPKRTPTPFQLVSLFDSDTNCVSLGFSPRGTDDQESIIAKIKYNSFDELMIDLFKVLKHANESHGNAGFAKGVAHVNRQIMQLQIQQQEAQRRAQAEKQAQSEAAQAEKKPDQVEAAPNQAQLQSQQNEGNQP